MIVCGIHLQTQSVLQIKDLLFYSSPELTLCCSADLISNNLQIIVSEATDLWKQGKSVNLVLTFPGYEEYYSLLLSLLPFPVSCTLQESNRYNRVLKSEKFIAESSKDLNIDLKSTENFKVLKLNLTDPTFLTGKNVNLNVLLITPRLSTKFEQLPLDPGESFIVGIVNEGNIVQCLNFIGRANRSLNLASGPDKLYKILMKYKDRLGRVTQIMEQQDLTFEQLIDQNRLLASIDHSF